MFKIYKNIVASSLLYTALFSIFSIFPAHLLASSSNAYAVIPYVQNFDTFRGSGFAPLRDSDALDSNAWIVSGLSDGSMEYGEEHRAGDFARGVDSDGVGIGGVYALSLGDENYALMIQPVGEDFTPGYFELRLYNDSGATMNGVEVAYKIWVLNDQDRSNSFNLSWGVNNDSNTTPSSFTHIPSVDFISPEPRDAHGYTSVERDATIEGIDLQDGGFLFLRWSGDDISGSGSRDEFALDDLRITPTNRAPSISPLSNISKNLNFSEWNVTLNRIVDLDSDTLHISVESNDTTFVTLLPFWENNLSYSNYHAKDLNFSIIPIKNSTGSVDITITLDDGSATTKESFILEIVEWSDDLFLDSLVARYDFQEDLNDSVGGVVGEIVPSSSEAQYINGIYGDALYLDGSYHIELPNIKSFFDNEEPDEWSVCVFASSDDIGSNDRVVVGDYYRDICCDTHFGVALSMEGGALRSGVRTDFNGQKNVNFSRNGVSNQWYHMCQVVSKTNQTLDFYVDGQKVDETKSINGSATYFLDNKPLLIGGKRMGGYYRFRGNVDSVEIYKSALNAQEIVRLWNGPKIFGIASSLSIVDNFQLFPFESVELDDRENRALSVEIAISDESLGVLTPKSIPSGTIEEVQSALRSVKFTPYKSGIERDFKLKLSVDNGVVETNSTTLLVKIYPNNYAPIWKLENNSTMEGESLDINLSRYITDRDTPLDTLQFWATSLDESLALATITSDILTITPQPHQHGVATITLYGFDGDNNISTDINITVININKPPTITDIPNYEKEYNFANFDVSFTIADPDRDDLNVTVINNSTTLVTTNQTQINNAAYATYNGVPQTLTLSSVANSFGKATIQVVAKDSGGLLDMSEFNLTVPAIIDFQTMGGQTIVLSEDFGTNDLKLTNIIFGSQNSVDIFVEFSNSGILNIDNNGSTVTSPNDHNLTFSSIANMTGTTTVTITASNGVEANVSKTITFEITQVNDAPVISGTPTSGAEGVAYSFTPTVTDVDNPSSDFRFSATNLPNWASIEESNGTITGTPTYSDSGTFSNIIITVNDGNATASLTTSITISNTNQAPLLTVSSISVAENQTAVTTAIASDPDGDAISYSLSGVDGALFAISNSGVITFVMAPDYENPSDNNQDNIYEIRVTLTDTGSATTSKDINITVTDVAENPGTITFSALTNQELSTTIESNTITLVGTDNNITISIVNGEYKIGDGAYTSSQGTINNDQSVTLRLTTSASYSTKVTATLTVGTQSANFEATTKAAPVISTPSGGGGGYTPPPTDTTQTDPTPESSEDTSTGTSTEESTNTDDDTGDSTQPESTTNTINITVVDDTTGEESELAIDKQETGVSIGVITGQTPLVDDTNTKAQFEIPLTNDSSGEKNSITIKSEQENIITATTEDGVTLQTSKSEGSKEITTNILLNNNGTTLITVSSKDNINNTSQNGAIIASLTTDTIINIDDDGGVTLSSQNSIAKVNSNGAVEHQVSTKQEDGTEAITKASSELPNSSVTILENGTVQTKGSVENSDGSKSTIAVDGKSDGKALHLIKTTNEDGTSTITRATSDIAGSETIIKQNGSVETSASIKEQNREIEIKATANTKGEATHEIEVKNSTTNETTTTKATSKIKGATTNINKEFVETKASKSVDEKIDARAFVLTDKEGNSYTGFEYFDKSLNKVIQSQPTLAEGSIYEAGNEATIEESEDGGLSLKVRTKVTKPIEFRDVR